MHDGVPENLVQCTFDFDALSDQPIDDVVLQVNSVPPQKQKFCPRCKQWLPATTEYWYRNKPRKDGLDGHCKTCRNKRYERYAAMGSQHVNSTPLLEQKCCSMCHQWFPTTPEYWQRDKTHMDGFRSSCKTCRRDKYTAMDPYHADSASLPKQRKCMKCNQWFPATLEYWHQDKRGTNGLHNYCTACVHKAYVARDPHPCIRCHTRTAILDRLCDECLKWKQVNPDAIYCHRCKRWLPFDHFNKQDKPKKRGACVCNSCRNPRVRPDRSEEIVQKYGRVSSPTPPKEQGEIQARNNKNQRERSARQRQTGMCSKCLAYPAEIGHLCKPCHDKGKQQRDKLRDEPIGEHPRLCIRCHVHIAIRYRLCDECYKRKQKNLNVKYCSSCKQWLSADLFGKKSSSKDGLRSTCKSCRHNDYVAHSEERLQKQYDAYHSQSPDEHRKLLDRQNKHRNERAVKEIQAGKCSKCLARPAEIGRICRRCYDNNKQSRDKLRDKVLAVYGGSCGVCGESNPAFLTVDHVDNDGADHRRVMVGGGGHRLYLWLRKNSFPQEGFQLLCANCNWRKYVSLRSGEKNYIQIWNANLREETLAAYGGKCVCCGESQADALTIDHVNNDGAEHRKITGGGSSFYSWLRKNRFPQDGRFQVLCRNCNAAKQFYGVCPHQIRDS